jgi:hypothetical protein
MKTADSNIKRALVMDWGGNHLLTADETRIIKRGYWASEEFFEFFDFELVSGKSTQVLDDPASIVISQSLAKALFANEDPLGKTIRLDNEMFQPIRPSSWTMLCLGNSVKQRKTGFARAAPIGATTLFRSL